MPFFGDNIPTLRLTFPDGTIRYVQATEDKNAYSLMVQVIEQHGTRFSDEQKVLVELVTTAKGNKE